MSGKKEKQLQLRSEPITQAMFDRLPGLLTRYQFKLVTGLSNEDMDALRAAKPPELKVWQSKPRGYHKYYKSDAARIAGFRMT